MTFVKKCGSPQGGVTSIRKVCHLMEKFDSHQGGGNAIRKGSVVVM